MACIHKESSDIENLTRRQLSSPIPPEWKSPLEKWILCLVKAEISTSKEFYQHVRLLARQFKTQPKKSQIAYVYRHMVGTQQIASQPFLDDIMITKPVRSLSGVIVVTVLTSPEPSYQDTLTGKRVTQRFSCKHNCYYCPNY